MLNCCSKLIASVFLILFIAVTPVIWLLLNVDLLMLRSELYKQALVEQKFYSRLMPLIVDMMGKSEGFNPCGEGSTDPRCQLEGPNDPHDDFVVKIISSARSDLKTCLQSSLGDSAFSALANARRVTTSGETSLTRACIKKYGFPAGVTSQGGMPPNIWILEPSDWQVILTTLVTPEWLQKTIESLLDQVFAYLDRKSDSVKISMTDLKSRLNGESGKALIAQMVRAQPPCTKDQLSQMLTGLTGNRRDPIACRPPEDMMPTVMKEVEKVASNAFSNIPNEVDVTQNMKSSSTPSSKEDPRDAFNRARTFLRLSILIPIVLFMLMTLFAVRSLGGLLRWWGAPLLIVGIIGFTIALAIGIGKEVALASLLTPDRLRTMPFTPSVVQLGTDVAKQIANTFTLWLVGQAIVIAGIGFVLLVASFFSKRNTDFKFATAA